jgi:hypothetical protein
VLPPPPGHLPQAARPVGADAGLAPRRSARGGRRVVDPAHAAAPGAPGDAPVVPGERRPSVDLDPEEPRPG